MLCAETEIQPAAPGLDGASDAQSLFKKKAISMIDFGKVKHPGGL